MSMTIPRANVRANTRPGAPAPAPAYKPKDMTGWTMQQAHQWRNQVDNEIGRRRNSGQDITNWQRYRQDANRYIQGLRGTAPAPELPTDTGNTGTPAGELPPDAPPPPAPDASTPPPPTPEPVTPAYDWNTYNSPMTQALMSAFQGNMQNLAQYGNQFYENNPFYNQAKKEGQTALSRRLAAQGLTGSGAEIEGMNDFNAKLMAAEAEKQRDWAAGLADRAQQGMQFISNYDQSERETLRNQANLNKDREIELSQFDATRNDAWRNQQLNTLMGILGLQAQTSPMNDIYKAIGDQGSIMRDLANKISSFQSNNYVRQTPSRVSGGGGAVPPPPPAADDTSLRVFEALMNRNNAGGNNSVLNTILSGIGGLFGGR